MGTIIKFSITLLSGTFFIVGLAIDNESVIGISGIAILTMLIYRKMNQVRLQYMAFQKIPEQMRNMMMKAFAENDDDDKRGYQ